MEPIDLPTMFGPYALNRRLAVGGMAEVFSATVRGEGGFEKQVALKRIHEHLSTDEQFVSMLISEAKLCASLHHKNIVQTFDLGCIDGAHFIVMEEVDGFDLGLVTATMRAREMRIPWSVSAHIVAEVCRGLGYAHQHEDDEGNPLCIVHRDVSPQNILLSLYGEVKVADFGIAKSMARVSDPEAGIIKGKYFYMSPEQAWGDPLAAATDVFSAGVVLWELLVGRGLRESKTVAGLLDEVRERPVPLPSSERPELPSAFDEIVRRATAMEPSERYADADEMADALDQVALQLDAEPGARLRSFLLDLKPDTTPELPAVVPATRDRISTLPPGEPITPPGATVRFSLDDGQPTVAGRRSPRSAPRVWVGWLAVAAAFGAAALGSWWLTRFL
ncbi:MAG: serine/threonine-protein kinase [Myxococcota bacterium]